MNDLASLLTAIGGLLTAAGATFALVWNTVRSSNKERTSAAENALERFVAAAEDGEITSDELAELRQEFRGGEGT